MLILIGFALILLTVGVLLYIDSRQPSWQELHENFNKTLLNIAEQSSIRCHQNIRHNEETIAMYNKLTKGD